MPHTVSTGGLGTSCLSLDDDAAFYDTEWSTFRCAVLSCSAIKINSEIKLLVLYQFVDKSRIFFAPISLRDDGCS